MRRGFYERFGRDINVKHEMVVKIINNEKDDIELKSLTFDKIIECDKERTQRPERSDLWFKTVNPYRCMFLKRIVGLITISL